MLLRLPKLPFSQEMYAEAFRGKVYNCTSNDSVLGQGVGVGGLSIHTEKK